MGLQLQARFAEPAAKLPVHRLDAYDRRLLLAPSAGNEREGPALPPTQASVRAHELLERRDLVRLGIEHAVDKDVGAVREAVGATEVVGRVAPEVKERIVAGDDVVSQPPCPSAPST